MPFEPTIDNRHGARQEDRGTHPEQRPTRAQKDRPMTQQPADFGSPADGPIWTCVGVYEEGMQAAIFYVHAPHVGGVLDVIEGAIRTERLHYSFTTVAIFKGALEEAH